MDENFPWTEASFSVDGGDAQAGLSPQSLAVPVNKRAASCRVDHTYHDFSRVSEAVERKKASNFPAKLHLILSDPECSHIISWMVRLIFSLRLMIYVIVMIIFARLINNLISGLHSISDHLKPHGRAWKIHNRELLVSEVVPKYFSHRKYESFTRQRSGWGFKCLRQSGNDFNAYYHECFLMGLPHLIGMMKRVRPNQGKLLQHAGGEPNFYEIDKQFPLSPPMMQCQGQFQCPPYHMEADAGYGAPQNPQVGYHTSHNQFYSSPETYGPPPPLYGPPPPFYGHYGDPNASAAYPQMGGYPPYPPHYPMQHDHQPYEQYPYYSYPPGPPRFAPSHRDNAAPSGAGAVNSEEVPSAEALREEVAITPQSNKPASGSLWPSNISAESENK